MKPNIYFISGIDTDAGKAIALPGMPSSYPGTDSASSPRNSFKPAIPDTPRTSTCTAASWAPAICLRITRGLQCPKSSPIPALPILRHASTTVLSTSTNRERHAGACPPLRHRTRGRSRRTDGSPDRRISHHRLHCR